MSLKKNNTSLLRAITGLFLLFPIAGFSETLYPSVFGVVEDGGGGPKDGKPDRVSTDAVVQSANTTVIEQRAVLGFSWFGVAPEISKATLTLLRFEDHQGPYPYRIDVYGYAGGTAVSLADWSAGELITSFEYSGEYNITLDLTAFIQKARASNNVYATLNFRVAPSSPSTSDGPRIAFWYTFASLEISHVIRPLDMPMASRSPLSTNAANGASRTDGQRAVSADGRYVVFSSNATDLVSGDTNNRADVFLWDRETRSTTRASLGSGGVQGNGDSYKASVSDDGRYVTFVSDASNLVSGDVNGLRDVFVRDLKTGVTTAISVDSRGVPEGGTDFSMSADGRFIAYCQHESASQGAEIVIYDRTEKTRKRIASPQSSVASQPSISADGRFLAFTAGPGVPTDNPEDGPAETTVYRYDRLSGAMKNVSTVPEGLTTRRSYAPSISRDGRFVAFGAWVSWWEDDVEHPMLRDRFDIYVRDVLKGITSQVNTTQNGGGISNSFPRRPSISGDGRYIAFEDFGDLIASAYSYADYVYVHDRLMNVTRRANSAPLMASNNSSTTLPSISADGRSVVYTSTDSTFAERDFNDTIDVFEYEVPQHTELSINAGGAGFTDSLGRFWSADRGFNTGAVSAFTHPIARTWDDVLYQTERWDDAPAPELQYRFAVPNGSYVVRLHFAENYARNFGVGRRQFDVQINGLTRFQNIDVFGEAGAQTALVKFADVQVTDGHLDIKFLHRNQSPIIDAIEVVEQFR